ncbi:MAG: conserved phage C-terminal domain-containing protein, partial [Bacteroides sp.]|nr:conserved phage C-terminal domain-containing protein [Bacteroides sp.]MCM1434406.1 conserved phage C-terminal domain-containing protein [Clostridiales bacterium]
MENNIEEKYDITCVYIYKDKVAIVDKSVGKFPELPWKKATSSKKAVRKIIDYLNFQITKVRQEEVNEIIGYFNERLGKRLNPTNKKYITLIQNLFNEGYGVEDFKKVIDNKIADWKDSKEMASNLKPTTLFRVSHFDEYLNCVEYKNPDKIENSPSYDLEKVMRNALDNTEIR